MIKFTAFCTEVLGLTLSPAWEVLASVSVDGEDPSTMTDERAALASQLFGGKLEEIPDVARRTLVWRLGRGSGKTTITAALGAFSMFTADCSGIGKGMVPAVVVVSPSLAASKRATRVARELIRASRLEKYVAKNADAVEGFELQRPDGRRVAFMSVAASRGGHTLRGFDVLTCIFDESEFFNSSSEVASGDTHVSDRDLLAAVAPRLHGSTILISTPWPSPNMTAELVATNHGAPSTALVAIGPSTLMRPDDKRLAERVAIEIKRDSETARREFFCEAIEGGGKFFDVAAIERSIATVPPQRSNGTCTAAFDPGFVRDASSLVILEHRRDGTVAIVHVDTVRPTRGTPLVPSQVLARFAPAIHAHGCNVIHSDSFNASSLRELAQAHHLTLQVHTESRDTKAARYMAFRDAISRDRVSLPNDKRLIDGLKSISGKALPGGAMSITAPRRAGHGHADAVSAAVLAFFAMSQGYSSSQCDDMAVRLQAIVRNVTPDDGSPRRNRGFIMP